MNKPIDPCETQRNNLIAAAIGLQHCTQADGTETLIPGTGKRILVGDDAYLAKMVAPAASQSQASRAVPEGWKLVPVEPTLEMQQAGFDTPGAHMYAASYRAMVAAAPEAPTAQEVTSTVFRNDGSEPDWNTYAAAEVAQEVTRQAASDEATQDMLVGATYALRAIAAGADSPADTARAALRVIASLSPDVTQQAAKAETAEQAEGDQANIIGQHEAIVGAVARGLGAPGCRYDELDFALVNSVVREVEEALASRFRAQGGNTNDKGSNLAPTTSTVSAAPSEEAPAADVGTIPLGVSNYSDESGNRRNSYTLAADAAALPDAQETIANLSRKLEEMTESQKFWRGYAGELEAKIRNEMVKSSAKTSSTNAGFSCAKRASDPSNEFAACRQHCGAASCLVVEGAQAAPTDAQVEKFWSAYNEATQFGNMIEATKKALAAAGVGTQAAPEEVRTQALEDAIEAIALVGATWVDDSNRDAAAPLLNEAISRVQALRTTSGKGEAA